MLIYPVKKQLKDVCCFNIRGGNNVELTICTLDINSNSPEVFRAEFLGAQTSRSVANLF